LKLSLLFAFSTFLVVADEWDSDIYEDVSKVLSVCMDVESADLPTAMDELSKTVAEHGGSPEDILKDFVETEPLVGFHWLSHHEKPIIPKSLTNFFEKHGHRCISEVSNLISAPSHISVWKFKMGLTAHLALMDFQLDLMRKSWKSDPIPFVNLLQSLVRNKIKFEGFNMNGPRVSRYKDDEALLSSLHTPLGFIGK